MKIDINLNEQLEEQQAKLNKNPRIDYRPKSIVSPNCSCGTSEQNLSRAGRCQRQRRKSGPRAFRRLGAVASPEGEGVRGPKAAIG